MKDSQKIGGICDPSNPENRIEVYFCDRCSNLHVTQWNDGEYLGEVLVPDIAIAGLAALLIKATGQHEEPEIMQ